MRRGRVVATVLLALVVGGCAARAPRPADAVSDPWEPFNRKIFWFNDKVDTYVLEPAAKGWDWALPTPVQRSISNFFLNVRFPVTMVNNVLQGKLVDGGLDMVRFGVNTTVGVGGFFDPASRMGLPRHDEDFGQTLAVWGIAPGPYLVLPIFGPSNPRDTVGLGVDVVTSITPFFAPWVVTIPARIVDTINARSMVLKQIDTAKESSFDFYVFVRDAYMQRRARLIADGGLGGQDLGPTDDIYNLETPQ